jgi:hypothetical protein
MVKIDFVYIWRIGLDKRVCEQKLSETTSTTPYATIAPGQCYVTPYGIVQVIYDDRATPTAVVENQEQAKSKLKLYYSALSKREARYQKQFLNVAVISQARRLLLQRDYERNQGNVDARAIRNIYEVCGSVFAPSPRSALDDPSAPPESHPDRIVEGLLIPDQRPRYLGPRRSNETDATPQQDFTLLEGLATTTDPTAALPKIFLPRRLLTTLYTPEATRYYCPCCFQCFASKPGYKYHVQEEGACRSKLQAKASAWAEQRRTIDARARQFVARYDASTHPLVPKKKHPPPLAGRADTAADPSVIPRKKPKKVSVLPADEPPAMPEDDLDASSSTLLHEPDTNDLDASNFVSPDVVLAQLEDEFYRLQGSMLGPMYSSIWKALGYRKPVTKPKRKRAKRDAAVAVPAASTTPSTDHADLAIVDIYPLVQEVDAGRYPSMKRYRGEHREDQCSICKEGDLVDGVDEGKLIPCNFCSQVEHFSCAQTKFILKYPEPGDDFMCHNCIGIIAARRMRAEKRRLEKLQSNEESSPMKSVPLQEQQYSSTDPARLKELHALTSGVVRNREFDCVAAQGSRLQELSVLLRDAKTRLTVRLEVMKMNQMRHSLIETAYSEDEIVGSRMQSSAKCFDA